MGFFDLVLGALRELATPTGVIFVVLGTLAGVVLGAIPGLGSSTLMVVLLPISYKMDITLAMALFISITIGGMSGGCIGSILLGIPARHLPCVPSGMAIPLPSAASLPAP